MAALDNIASELIKSANEADLIYKKTRDQAQLDKAVRLRRIVENISQLTIGDMDKSVYDTDDDGVVDASETVRIVVRNSTGSTLNKGSVVYLSEATGNRPNAFLAQANAEATSSKTIGIVVANIANNADGYVAVSGTLHDLDTSAFSAGNSVWLSATVAGGWTTTVPTEPNHSVFIGYIARSHPTQGRLVIAIQNGYELNELHDVVISSAANNDLLRYNFSLGYWENQPISTIFGGTPLVSVPTLAQVTTAGNTTTNAITVGGLNVNGIQVITSADVANRDVGPAAFNITNGTFSRFNVVYDASIARINILGTSTEGLRIEGGSGSSITKIGSGGITISAPSNNLYLNGASLLFATGNVERARVNSNGNFLIGTNTDAGYKLDVNGTGRFSSTLTIATTASDASPSNSILITTASSGNGGRISWGDFNTSILRFVNSLYFREYTGNFVFQSTGSSTILFAVRPSNTTVSSGKFITNGSTTAASALAQGVFFNNTLVAAANNDVLVGLDINPTFTNGAFTGVTNYALRVSGTISQFTSPGATQIRIEGPSGANKSVFFFNTSSTFANTRIYNTGTTNQFIIATGDATIAPTDRFTIFQTGNVAINSTTDAGYKLDVNGTARVKTDLKIETNTGGLTIEGDASGYPTLSINTLRSGVDRRNWKFATEQVSAGDFIFYRSSTGGGAANTVVYAISKDGNFGLGTTTPTDKFHIVDNTNGNKFARISAGGTDASAAWVAQNDQVDNIVYRVFGSAVTGSQMGQALARSASLIANLGGTGKFLIGSYSGTDLIFGTSDQARMRLVDATGNFLIGTMTDTGNKLTVSGNIDAQGYKVNNVLGYTGILNIPTNPPGQQNIDIQGGIVINIF